MVLLNRYNKISIYNKYYYFDMQLTINRFKANFPANKKIWKRFTMTALPVILAAFIFSLNAFVDNFMSINIAGGNQALSYANAWTEIQLGIVSATTIIGTALFSQYLGKQDWFKVREVLNLRMTFSLAICLVFVIPSVAATSFMIDVISGFDNMSTNIKDQAIDYLRIITIAWLLNTWAFTATMILRERNHVFISMFVSLMMLLINITLNSIFIYGMNLGIVYLAYSTIISNAAAIIFIMTWIWFKDRRIFINIFTIFQVSPHIVSQFFKRIWSFFLFAIGSITVNIRFIIWNIGFGTGSIGDFAYRLSAATILGITGMFFNIFWTSFESMSATVAVYVGKELGKNNIEQAKVNAKQLQGFHIVVGFVIGLIALTFSFTTIYMTFLAGGYEKELVNYYSENSLPVGVTLNQIISGGRKIFLENIKYTLLGITVFIPMFVWFVSRSRIISVGGRTNLTASIEAFIGLFQTAWLVMICLGLTKLNVSFGWSYFIFYLSDIPKFFIYEIIYHKIDWAKNITHEDKID